MTEEFHGEEPGATGALAAPYRLVADQGPGARPPAPPPLRLRRYREQATNAPLMVKSGAGEAAETSMSREYEVSCTLARHFGPGRTPPELARVLRYDRTVRPHRLLLDLHGECMGGWDSPDRVHGPQLKQLLISLFTALAALHNCRLVHTRVSPDHLWWSAAEGLQLAGLEGVVTAGEPLPRQPVSPWDPPGLGQGAAARHEHDVHSAGLVAFWLATGETIAPGSSAQQIRDRLRGHDRFVQDLLHRVFPEPRAGQEGNRPPAAWVIVEYLGPSARRRADRVLAGGLAEAESKARGEFLELRLRQAEFRSPRQVAAGGGGRPRGTQRRETRGSGRGTPPGRESRGRSGPESPSQQPPSRSPAAGGRQPAPDSRGRPTGQGGPASYGRGAPRPGSGAPYGPAGPAYGQAASPYGRTPPAEPGKQRWGRLRKLLGLSREADPRSVGRG